MAKLKGPTRIGPVLTTHRSRYFGHANLTFRPGYHAS